METPETNIFNIFGLLPTFEPYIYGFFITVYGLEYTKLLQILSDYLWEHFQKISLEVLDIRSWSPKNLKNSTLRMLGILGILASKNLVMLYKYIAENMNNDLWVIYDQ